MKIAVCDDEKIFRDEITEKLYSFWGKLDVECSTFCDGSELVKAYKNGSLYDAVFLDIEMPELDGLKTASKLRSMGVDIPIIFLTSHTELAMEGYEVYAFRFLAKPINEDKLLKTLRDLKEELSVKKCILVKSDGDEIPLRVDEIIYIESMNNSISIVLKNEIYVVRKKLGEIEKEINELTEDFVRIHRGYIVNLSKVKKHHGNEVLMTNDYQLPISRSALNEFKKKLFDYIKNQAR